ncbi:kelch-like protein [Archangium gephyra]|uniref:Kelch repeat-containing protein n=1 Tax=Archangium gephyra TaxID=48 RepID=UPI0035D4783D
MQRKAFTLLPWLAAVWVVIVSGCQPEVPTGSVQLVGSLQQALATSDVTRVAVTVTAADMVPLSAELVKTGGHWSGTLGRVPAGADRTFRAEAFGAEGTKLFTGSATGITITPGRTALVAITLQETAARPPFENAVPIIDALVASASSASPGESVTLRATAHDPNPTDALTYAWTATAGTLGSASSATTTWTAPEATAPVTLKLTVTDPHGSSATVSLSLKVRGASGGADVDVTLNTWPLVARIVATPSRVNVGEATTVVATASDADGDALAYRWSASGCTGSWTGETSATARFTPDAVPPGGACDCRLGVTVEDGRGGQALGTLAMCVGEPPVPLFAPEVVSTFQSASTAPAGGTVTLRVEAEDPQGSALAFSWAASAGTLGTPASSATRSEVVWTAPGCVLGGGSVTLTATVRNALGLSTSTPFTVVRDVPDCLRPGTWSAVGGLSRARQLHTATLLPSGLVLMVGGADGPPDTVSEEVFDPETGLSTLVGSGSSEPFVGYRRYLHTATLLPTGKVLVVGKSDKVDLFDSVSWTWAPTGSMSTYRERLTATLLPTGKVLVAGGAGSDGAPLATAELYDPETGTWSPAAPMAAARSFHTATLLPTGKVLVTGGQGSAARPLETAELYDPETGTWSPAGAMSVGREAHTATLLPTGKVLVAGGHSTLLLAETYDPETGTWTPAGTMSQGSFLLSATLLPTGKVLVVGESFAEVYDPETGNWTPTGAPVASHYLHAATLLPTGKVLVTGGSRSLVEVYDPMTGAWTPYGGEPTAGWGHSATLLPAGSVLMAGGTSFGVKAALYEPARGTWRTTGSMTTARARHTATLLPTGRVLVAGGHAAGSSLATAELYDPATGAWSPTGAMRVPRYGHFALMLPTGRVLVLGGGSSVMELYDPETGTWAEAGTVSVYGTATLLATGKVLVVGYGAAIYDPATGTWTPTGAMTWPREQHTATVLASGKVLVVGGFGPDSPGVEVYDPATGTWAPTGAMTWPRGNHTATVLASGKVLVAGGVLSSPVVMSELYDPVTGNWSLAGDIDAYCYGHTATRLPSGQVLVVNPEGGFFASTLLYNP